MYYAIRVNGQAVTMVITTAWLQRTLSASGSDSDIKNRMPVGFEWSSFTTLSNSGGVLNRNSIKNINLLVSKKYFYFSAAEVWSLKFDQTYIIFFPIHIRLVFHIHSGKHFNFQVWNLPTQCRKAKLREKNCLQMLPTVLMESWSPKRQSSYPHEFVRFCQKLQTPHNSWTIR